MPSPGKKSRDQVSDAAVEAKTGKNWQQWLRLLDRAGAKKLDHKGIVALVKAEGASPWYQQMITVVYEQERGLREVHEKPKGFEVGRSKTVGVSLDRLYRAFAHKSGRSKWLGDVNWTVRKATVEKSMRITWEDGKTHLDVYFYEKGPGKAQVTLQHGKLANARQAEKMKTYWAEKLSALKQVLES